MSTTLVYIGNSSSKVYTKLSDNGSPNTQQTIHIFPMPLYISDYRSLTSHHQPTNLSLAPHTNLRFLNLSTPKLPS